MFCWSMLWMNVPQTAWHMGDAKGVLVSSLMGEMDGWVSRWVDGRLDG